MITYLWQGMDFERCGSSRGKRTTKKLLPKTGKRGKNERKKLTNNNVNVWKIYYPGGRNEKV